VPYPAALHKTQEISSELTLFAADSPRPSILQKTGAEGAVEKIQQGSENEAIRAWSPPDVSVSLEDMEEIWREECSPEEHLQLLLTRRYNDPPAEQPDVENVPLPTLLTSRKNLQATTSKFPSHLLKSALTDLTLAPRAKTKVTAPRPQSFPEKVSKPACPSNDGVAMYGGMLDCVGLRKGVSMQDRT